MHLVSFSLKFVQVRKMSYEVDNLGIVSHGSEVFHRSWRKMRNNHQSLEPKDDECATEITNNLPKLQKENKCEEDDGYLR